MHAVKVHGEVTTQLCLFLICEFAASDCSSSNPNRFNSDYKAPSNYWIVGRVVTRTGLDVKEKSKNLWNLLVIEPRIVGRPARSLDSKYVLSAPIHVTEFYRYVYKISHKQREFVSIYSLLHVSALISSHNHTFFKGSYRTKYVLPKKEISTFTLKIYFKCIKQFNIYIYNLVFCSI